MNNGDLVSILDRPKLTDGLVHISSDIRKKVLKHTFTNSL
jgi:hypothetical protein